MGQKLNRSQPSMFDRRREHTTLKRIGTLLLCVAVLAAGFFSAKWATESQQRHRTVKTADASVTPAPSTPEAAPPSADNDVVIPGDDTVTPTPLALDRIRAFYLPPSFLSVDKLTADLLQDAHKAGFNAVVIDLKDAEGNLYYHSSTPQAQKVNAYASGALTTDQLTALFDLIRECGLQPIPRLYAFRDNVACGVLTNARISYVDNHSWAWYDGVRDKGAKKWLNPYSDEAQDYIQSLLIELKELGAPAILLEGVQFPDRLDKNAYLGDKAASIGKSDILTSFIKDIRTELGADCPLLLGCTGESALGTETKAYGGNPLTFGAAVVSPILSAKVTESVEKMILRTQVLVDKPILTPTLLIKDISAQEVSERMAAGLAGGTGGFILYHPEGNYDFAAYTLP